MAQSEEALTRILALCRKYGLYLTLAHQTWSQASQRLRGALQNAGVEVAFKLGRADAELEARTLGSVELAYGGQRGQWEAWTQRIEGLGRREALIKTPFVSTTAVETLEVRDAATESHTLHTVLSEYARLLPSRSTSGPRGGGRR